MSTVKDYQVYARVRLRVAFIRLHIKQYGKVEEMYPRAVEWDNNHWPATVHQSVPPALSARGILAGLVADHKKQRAEARKNKGKAQIQEDSDVEEVAGQGEDIDDDGDTKMADEQKPAPLPKRGNTRKAAAKGGRHGKGKKQEEDETIIELDSGNDKHDGIDPASCPRFSRQVAAAKFNGNVHNGVSIPAAPNYKAWTPAQRRAAFEKNLEPRWDVQWADGDECAITTALLQESDRGYEEARNAQVQKAAAAAGLEDLDVDVMDEDDNKKELIEKTSKRKRGNDGSAGQCKKVKHEGFGNDEQHQYAGEHRYNADVLEVPKSSFTMAMPKKKAPSRAPPTKTLRLPPVVLKLRPELLRAVEQRAWSAIATTPDPANNDAIPSIEIAREQLLEPAVSISKRLLNEMESAKRDHRDDTVAQDHAIDADTNSGTPAPEANKRPVRKVAQKAATTSQAMDADANTETPAPAENKRPVRKAAQKASTSSQGSGSGDIAPPRKAATATATAGGRVVKKKAVRKAAEDREAQEMNARLGEEEARMAEIRRREHEFIKADQAKRRQARKEKAKADKQAENHAIVLARMRTMPEYAEELAKLDEQSALIAKLKREKAEKDAPEAADNAKEAADKVEEAPEKAEKPTSEMEDPNNYLDAAAEAPRPPSRPPAPFRPRPSHPLFR
jgi:hypothetical protein